MSLGVTSTTTLLRIMTGTLTTLQVFVPMISAALYLFVQPYLGPYLAPRVAQDAEGWLPLVILILLPIWLPMIQQFVFGVPLGVFYLAATVFIHPQDELIIA